MSAFSKKYGNQIGNTSLTQFDVLIIGSGAGGSAAAEALTRNGQKVLILEAGINTFQGLDASDPQNLKTLSGNDQLKFSNRYFISPDPEAEPKVFRSDENEKGYRFWGDNSLLPRTVGGAAIIADLLVPRFAPDDFHLGTLLKKTPMAGTTFADWPVDYDQLEKFYCHTEQVIGAQGEAGANPFEGPRSAPYPMKPGLPMYVSLKAAAAAKKVNPDYSPFPNAAAINSRPYGGRPACVNCGFCIGVPCVSSAKGSPAVTFLRKALLTRNCLLMTETKVTRLLMDSSKRKVIGVEALDAKGKVVQVKADRYILAANPIESTRIVLRSAPGGVGNSSGMVGRNLTFHFKTHAVGIFNERLHAHRGRISSHCMVDFRGKPGDTNKPLGGIVELGGGSDPIAEGIAYALQVPFGKHYLSKWMRESPLRDRLMVLTMIAEDAPQYANRLDLDPNIKDFNHHPVIRTTYKNHSFELNARAFYGPKMIEIVKAAGALYTFIPPAAKIPDTHHVLGTLRFGNDPKASVCDGNGKFHDVENLYCVDGSIFPTSSGYNPTLTIMALANRVGSGMVFPQDPERGLPIT